MQMEKFKGRYEVENCCLDDIFIYFNVLALAQGEDAILVLLQEQKCVRSAELWFNMIIYQVLELSQ